MMRRSSRSSANLLAELKIKNPTLKINSIGDRVCRPNYKRQLQNYYKNYEKELCEDCVRRLNDESAETARLQAAAVPAVQGKGAEFSR